MSMRGNFEGGADAQQPCVQDGSKDCFAIGDDAEIFSQTCQTSGAPETEHRGLLGARMGFNRSFDDQQKDPTPSTTVMCLMTATACMLVTSEQTSFNA